MKTAIHTKYSNRAGAGFIIARCRGNVPGFSVRVPYDFELNRHKRHPAAAKALAEKLGWSGLWIVAGNEDGSVCCACVPGSYSRAWVDKWIPGEEGEDWFFIPEIER